MKFCTNCGNPLKDEALFCTKCGEKQGEIVSEPVEAPSAVGPVPQPSTEVETVQTNQAVTFEAEVTCEDAPVEPFLAQVTAETDDDFDEVAELDGDEISKSAELDALEVAAAPLVDEVETTEDSARSEQDLTSGSQGHTTLPPVETDLKCNPEVEPVVESNAQVQAERTQMPALNSQDQQVISTSPVTPKVNDSSEAVSETGSAESDNCIACGHALIPGAAFCTNCGRPVSGVNAVKLSLSNQTRDAVNNAKEAAHQVMNQIDKEKLKQESSQIGTYAKAQLKYPNSQIQNVPTWVSMLLLVLTSALVAFTLPVLVVKQGVAWVEMLVGSVEDSMGMVEMIVNSTAQVKMEIRLVGQVLVFLVVLIGLAYLVKKILVPQKVNWVSVFKQFANYLVLPCGLLGLASLLITVGWGYIPFTICVMVVAYLVILSIPTLLILETYATHSIKLAPMYALLILYGCIFVVWLVVKNLAGF